jgi:hypothetical protein
MTLMRALLPLAALHVAACGGGASSRAPSAAAAGGSPVAPSAAVVAAPAPPPPLPGDLEPEPEPAPASTDTVTIKLIADARRQARVTWGRKDLGMAPLEIVRPRGSAPLDLLIVAPGYLPLRTRVFTDRNDVLALRLYTEREASVLPGFSGNRKHAPSPTTKPRQ